MFNTKTNLLNYVLNLHNRNSSLFPMYKLFLFYLTRFWAGNMVPSHISFNVKYGHVTNIDLLLPESIQREV